MEPAVFEKKMGSIIDEYLASTDEVEACACVKELEADDDLLSTLVVTAVLHVMEKKERDRTMVDELMMHLGKQALIKQEHVVAGLTALMNQVPDMVMDVPKFGQYVSNTMATLLAHDVMAPEQVKALFEPVSGTSQGAKMFVWLYDHVVTLTDEDRAKAAYSQAGMTAAESLHEDDRTDEEFKIVLERSKPKNQMEWLFA
eukprot:TRINITY_DN8059_c0_g2_i1.p2 TRINITY_DN8059_c0_g2~~TRINITY_DN8059_c0_g2_i1.p2  ORF type:complete len:200 (+),score=76.03 TRINITY_DN8059_c0_g2_i1:286-885(+)